jgi:hypothetical protein
VSRNRAHTSTRTRVVLAVISLLLAAGIWLPSIHVLFRPSDEPDRPMPAQAAELAERHLRLWLDDGQLQAELQRMRPANAEWDFMGRSFLVWALANMCLRDPSGSPRWLAAIDRIIDQTLQAEGELGMFHFLMPYAQHRPFVQQPPRSLFLDGELALMLGLRRLVAERADYRAQMAARLAWLQDRMLRSPTLSAESYPDECWTFCNTVALAALRLGDHLDGTDHEALRRDWVLMARSKLLDPATGLLVSSYTLDGKHLDGPEGSSLWMSAHDLLLVDEAFAREQFALARRHLVGSLFGFSYAREWPQGAKGQPDVDSGPVVPLLQASAGSSGLALLGASAFGDRRLLRSLRASLELAAFPERRNGALRYAASNQVGDAVLLYSLVQGPAWSKVLSGDKR